MAEAPKYATAPRVTLGDLEKRVTLETIESYRETLVLAVHEATEAALEHWTDDEGLHEVPFVKQMIESAGEAFDALIADLVRDAD